MLHRWTLAVQPRDSLNNQQKSANYGVMTAGDFTASLADIPVPPVERWNPDFCGDNASRIVRASGWFHRGVLGARQGLS